MGSKPSLKLFDDAQEAFAAARTSKAGDDLQVLRMGPGHYLKKPGEPNVEPKFLCQDGRWRRYDLVPELPGSAAASV